MGADGATQLADLHAEVDRVARRVAEHDPARFNCRKGCSSCCQDGLTVFELEADRIRAFLRDEGISIERGAPGTCVFLSSEGACQVYRVRPYVCRTQGLPLRWWSEEDQAERRSICPLNEAGPPLVTLGAGACFELGPFEARLAQLQAEGQGVRPGTPLRRVSLRSLAAD